VIARARPRTIPGACRSPLRTDRAAAGPAWLQALTAPSGVPRPLATPYVARSGTEVAHKLVFGDGVTSVDITADPMIAAVPG